MFYQKKSFIDSFIKLIKDCNKIVLDIYNTDFNVQYKSDLSPLTYADEQCNNHICNFLKQFNKDNDKNILIISEENKTIDYEIRNKFDWVWLIDPIDGTKEFIKKNGEFTINIGLCYKGVPVFGIVSIPVLNHIYYGAENIGSYKLILNENNNIIKTIHLWSHQLYSTPIKIIVSRSHINKDTLKFINRFTKYQTLRSGSSIKLLLIAENKADIYPRIGLTSEWDTCATHAILKYANAKVINFYTKKELRYNKKNLLNPFFICSNKLNFF